MVKGPGLADFAWECGFCSAGNRASGCTRRARIQRVQPGREYNGIAVFMRDCVVFAARCTANTTGCGYNAKPRIPMRNPLYSPGVPNPPYGGIQALES